MKRGAPDAEERIFINDFTPAVVSVVQRRVVTRY